MDYPEQKARLDAALAAKRLERARKEALKHCPRLRLLDTKVIMIDLIKGAITSIDEADALKEAWERDHRFKLNFKSFRDLSTP